MINRLLCIVGFCLLALNTMGQKRVFIPFTVPVFVDDFKAPDKTWPIIKTSEMYSNYDNGDYYLIRNNPVSPYVLMADWPNNVEKFYLKTAVRLAPGLEKEQSIGIVVMASKDGENGLIIDINRFRDYRIRRIKDGKYIYITGSENNKGWESSANLKGKEDENMIELKTDNGEYDLYFNGDYTTSFSAHELFNGNFGIYIGPNTKARVPYYHVVSVRNTEGNTSVAGTNYAEMLEATLLENKELKKLLLEQKKKIAELTEENPTETTQLKKTIGLMEEQLKESNSRIRTMEKTIVQFQIDNSELQTKNANQAEEINKLSTDLSIARGDSSVRLIKGSSADQVIIMLSKSLDEQLNRNDILENERDVMHKQYKELNDEFKNFKRLLLDYMKTESMANINEMRDYALLPFDVKPILGYKSALHNQQIKNSETSQALRAANSKSPTFLGKQTPVVDQPKVVPVPEKVTEETKEPLSLNEVFLNADASETDTNSTPEISSEVKSTKPKEVLVEKIEPKNNKPEPSSKTAVDQLPVRTFTQKEIPVKKAKKRD